MEPRPSTLDRSAPLLLGRPSRRHGLRALAICGILLVVIGFLLVFEPPRSGPDLLPLSGVCALVLAQLLAAGRHLLFERRRRLARALGLMSAIATIAWLVLLVTYFLWFSPNPLLGSS